MRLGSLPRQEYACVQCICFTRAQNVSSGCKEEKGKVVFMAYDEPLMAFIVPRIYVSIAQGRDSCKRVQ